MCNRDIILCVDDEENQLTMRTLLLESKGYTVVPASSGLEALDMLACYPVDLVLSDHLMPGVTGAELARLIKLANPDLPVILISALVDRPAGSEFADLFMSKLDGPVVMCDNVASMLEQSKNRSLT